MSHEVRTLDRDFSFFGVEFVKGDREVRAKIVKLEKILAALPEAFRYDPPIKHHYGHKVYGREMFMPKGCVVVSRIHRYENLNILSQGEVTVLSEFGLERLKAGAHIEAPAGVKRVIFAHSDVVWTTFYGTELKDPEAILDAFYATTFDEVAGLALEGEVIASLGEN